MESRTAITLRVPTALLDAARGLKREGESLNDLAVRALEEEIRHRSALRAHASIVERRAAIRARTGPQPDMTAEVRAWRGGEERRA